jgi:hypothetical protein
MWTSALKKEAVCSSEKFVAIYMFAQYHKPTDSHRHLHHFENFISHLCYCSFVHHKSHRDNPGAKHVSPQWEISVMS